MSWHEIEQTTFLKVENVLDRCVKTFAKTLRWCPACLFESSTQGEESYFKLIWQLQCVERCGNHRVKLQERCPHCETRQSTLGRWTTLSRCYKCEGELGNGFYPQSFTEQDTAEMQYLTEDIASEDSEPYPTNAIRISLDRLLDAAWSAGSEQSLWRLLPRDEYVGYVSGHIPMTLANARRIAFRLHVPLVDLLRGSLAETASVLPFVGTNEKYPPALAPGKRQWLSELDKIRDELERSLDPLNSPQCPSLRQFARDHRISVGAMQHRFPDLCKRLSYRYKQQLDGSRRSQRLSTEAAVAAVVARFLADEPSCLSRKAVVREVRSLTALPKNLIREAVKRFFSIEASSCPVQSVRTSLSQPATALAGEAG